ncbi:hypothetical protein [Vibrio nigripulchritudo]|uniref:hypothetical protein n=1 Tax=Vibrio nigripulchritudo TaxID=28173 RepID=UPI0024934DE1|nr:hypothetical protein [Vibrio nigripulchritudo]BDU37422.1 hypothetical protein TUMSATVNIG2_18910 [Vibrio nigripulchritudo]BDU43143.1 hypothetical protein TUMSATVNIG3_19410 [Vibrio nigripulchritudo]
MNQIAIQNKAKVLWRLLKKYSEHDDLAMQAFHTLKSILEKAQAGEITSPLKWDEIPCGYMFVEKGLGKYRDLESAYADFKVEVTDSNDALLDIISKL